MKDQITCLIVVCLASQGVLISRETGNRNVTRKQRRDGEQKGGECENEILLRNIVCTSLPGYMLTNKRMDEM